MKFTEEGLVELQDKMNELYSKCDYCISFIERKFKTKTRELSAENEDYKTALYWKKIENPFSEEYVFLMGEDNDFLLDSNGLKVVGKTPIFHDSCLEEKEYLIPYEWLELDGEELDKILQKIVDEKIDFYIEDYRKRKIKIEEREKIKAKEVLSKLSKEELQNLINNN